MIDAEGLHEVREFAEREPYYPPLICAMPKPGMSRPTAETQWSFALTCAALCARDAADQRVVITDLTGPWDESVFQI